jgi:thiol-disulfide isomerase/thioredoxin
VSAAAAPVSKAPADPKAKKSYDEATVLMKERRFAFALDGFRKADKQDGGHCIPCELEAYKAARQINDFKASREVAAALIESVTSKPDKSLAHFMLAETCLAEGVDGKHDKALTEADAEFQTAFELQPGRASCLYGEGLALAHLKQDGAAKERFEQYLKAAKPDDLDYARAARFSAHPELARARVPPNFRLTTLDGQTLTLEGLTGKVVLLDFWATWCGPCREALPRIHELAQRFQGQPFVVVSISMDKDETKWKEFIAKNGMTWMQYRDGYFEGPIAKMFDVNAIPATFTIDADGVLQDQHVGDAEIEGKIKKLIARANEIASHKTALP